MSKSKLKKVTAKVTEVYVEPDYHATYKCPYCKQPHHEELDEPESGHEEKIKCDKCKRFFIVKMPKEEKWN